VLRPRPSNRSAARSDPHAPGTGPSARSGIRPSRSRSSQNSSSSVPESPSLHASRSSAPGSCIASSPARHRSSSGVSGRGCRRTSSITRWRAARTATDRSARNGPRKLASTCSPSVRIPTAGYSRSATTLRNATPSHTPFLKYPMVRSTWL